jgi:hypothetical protein
MDQLMKGSIQIQLHLNNINREEGFKLSQAWNLTNKILQTITQTILITLDSVGSEMAG